MIVCVMGVAQGQTMSIVRLFLYNVIFKRFPLQRNKTLFLKATVIGTTKNSNLSNNAAKLA